MTPLFQLSNLPIFLAHWTHDLNPVIFYIWKEKEIGLRWYGLAYLIGFLGGYYILKRLAKRNEFAVPEEKVGDFILYLGIFGVFLGGRLGYAIFYDLSLLNPITFIQVWKGGMASHGGILGVLFTTIWFARKWKAPLWNLTDHLALVAPIGLFFGRVANFINAELWGRTSDVPWAVIFPDAGPEPRHPSQLYEAFGEGLFLFIALWLLRLTPWGKREGSISAMFLLFYAAARIGAEFFRVPDDGYGLYFGWMTKGQLYSAFMVLGTIAIIAVKKLYKRRTGIVDHRR